MPKVKIPAVLLLLLKTGVDISLCPKCGIGKMQLIATYININGSLKNIDDLNNKGSPLAKTKINSCVRN
jgi:hypothetical protein